MIEKICLESMSNKLDASRIYEMLRRHPKIKASEGYLYTHNDEKIHWEKIRKRNEQQEIRGFFSNDSQGFLSTAILNEVIQRIKSSPEFQHDFKMHRKRWLINMRNGVYNIQTKKLEEYKDDMFFTYVVNVNYISGSKISKCQYFMKFAESSLEADEKNPKLKLVLEIFGYLISDLEGAKLAFFLIGKGNSGKSMLLNLLRHVVGETFCSTVAFDKLANQFDTAKLYDKRVNICSEVSSVKIPSPDVFKGIVSHDVIMADRKNKDQLIFRVETKLVTAGNILPRFKHVDGTNAVADRMLVVKFNRSILKNEWIQDLDKKLINEADTIFSVAVDMLEDLSESNFAFTIIEESKDCIDEYRKSQNSIEEFIEDCCKIHVSARVHKAKLWEAYKKFCSDNCYDLLIDPLMFGDKIISISGVIPKKFRIQGPPLSGYYGITLKEESNYINNQFKVLIKQERLDL